MSDRTAEVLREKKVYETPVLRRLGSVQDLTRTGMGNGKEPVQSNKRSTL